MPKDRATTKPTAEDYWSAWSRKNAIQYYTSHRSSINDVYQSERYFLTKIVRPGMSILDVGCAAGGFYKIFKSLQPMISYTGVDVSEEMIKKAMQLHKSVPFKVINGSNLDFNNDSFDLVFCSGVLHNTLNWRALLKECWRVAREYFVFDVRLIQDAPSVEDMTISYQKIAFSNQWDEKSVVPYAVLNVNDFLTFVKKLKPQPMVLRAFGYFNPVSNMAVTPHKEACMTMFCLSKVAKEGEKNEWKVPLDLPAGIM